VSIADALHRSDARGASSSSSPAATATFGPRRARLSASTACNSYPAWLQNGGWALYAAAILYLFLGIAIVCDDFFTPSLEVICARLNLSEDVAGATFMAAGSSAPELFTSTMSLVSSNATNELGVATIVGSAVFNILIIIACTIIFSGGDALELDWKPVTRDCVFYACSIAFLLAIMSDGKVWWYEGVVSVGLYLVYVYFMTKNARIMAWVDAKVGGGGSGAKKKKKKNTVAPAAEETDEEKGVAAHRLDADADDDAVTRAIVTTTRVEKTVKNNEEEEDHNLTGDGALFEMMRADLEAAETIDDDAAETIDEVAAEAAVVASTVDSPPLPPLPAPKPPNVFDRISVRVAPGAVTESYVPVDDRNDDDDDDDDDDRSPFAPPSSLAAYPLWLLSLPWYAAFRVTCPDCSKPDGEKYYLASFFVSVFWISAISYGMVDAAAAVGCILGIPEVVMGTLVLAAGTSIPDALSSVSVAQSGQGDMAVANAVGSNVFDILLGLGLPWIVFLPSRGGFEVVSTKQLWPSIFILAGVLALYYSTVAGNKFKLVKSMGYAYLATYAAFVVYSLVAVWYLDVYDVHGK